MDRNMIRSLRLGKWQLLLESQDVMPLACIGIDPDGLPYVCTVANVDQGELELLLRTVLASVQSGGTEAVATTIG
jgi:hypothetical protein